MRQSTTTRYPSGFLPTLAYLAVAFGLAFAGVSTAYAADVVFDEDTTVTVSGNDYVILVGSEATTVDVGATTATVTAPSGSTFTFQSPDRHVLNNDGGIAQTCTEDDNRLLVTGPKSSVVITPDPDTLCTGDPVPPPSPSPPPSSSSGDSVGNQFNNLIAMGDYQTAWDLMEQWPHLFTEEDRQLVAEKLQEAKLPQEEPLYQTREQLLQQIRELQLQVIELSSQLIQLLQQQISSAAMPPSEP